MNTDTPRTNAIYRECVSNPSPGNGLVLADFARQLERELSEANVHAFDLDTEYRLAYIKHQQERDQLRDEVERLKGSHGYDADYWFEEYEGQRKLAIDLSFKCDKWREDAERLAELHRHSNHSAANPVAGCQPCAALAAHERLVKEAKK